MAVKPKKGIGKKRERFWKEVWCSFVKTILSKALAALTDFELIVFKLIYFIIQCTLQRLRSVTSAENDALVLD
jgi:hypothetical protein